MADGKNTWKLSPAGEVNAAALAEFGYGPLVAKVLAARGVSARADIARALGQDLPVCDPATMRDLPAAAARIREELERGGRITVFGDYDVDGLTASYLLWDWLRRRGADCGVYLPEREGEGYGMSAAALEKIASDGTALIVSVDNGITAVEEAALAARLGMDMVVTDHHTPGETLPDCCAVVDPHRADCPYENKELAGVGVAFKLLCLLDEGGEAAVMQRYGDMLALGTVADMCGVTGENRRLLAAAEPVLRQTKNPGLRALAAKAGCPQPRLIDIPYRLGPRLNAAGRMGSASMAFELLRSGDAAEAEANAEVLAQLNARRQAVENRIAAEAEAMVDPAAVERERGIVLRGDGWKLGVLGIVAAKLVERHGVPVILATEDGGVLKGSARTAGEYDLYGAMQRAAEGIGLCGGHRAAAGIKMEPARFDEFRRRFLAVTAAEAAGGEGRVVEADCEAEPSELTTANVAALERLAPFGPGNRQPAFCLRDVRVASVSPTKTGRHTRLTLEKGGAVLTAFWFGRGLEAIDVGPGDLIDLIVSAEIEEYRGLKSVRCVVTDAMLSGERATERLRALLSGQREPLPPPSREACAVVWSALAGQTGPLSARTLLRRVVRRREMDSLTVLAALEAFAEAGLVTGPDCRRLAFGETADVALPDRGGEKAALWETAVFKAFQRS